AGLVVALAALGLSIKLVALPLLSAASPSLMYAPLDHLKILIRYLTAYDYSGRFYAFGLGERILRLGTQGLGGLLTQAGWAALLLAGVGLWSRRRERGPVLTVVAGGGLAVWLVSRFQIAGVGYYLLPVVMGLSLYIAAGLADLEARAGRRAATGAAVCLMLFAAWRGLPGADRGRYYGATDWGRTLLHSLDPGAVLVTQHDDDFYPPMYLQRVLGEREDVVVIHRPFL